MDIIKRLQRFSLIDAILGVQWYDLMVDASGLQVDVDVAVSFSYKKIKVKKKKKGDDEEGGASEKEQMPLVKGVKVQRFVLNDEGRRGLLKHHASHLKITEWDGLDDEFHEEITNKLCAWAKKLKGDSIGPTLESNPPKSPKGPWYWK